MRTIILLLGMLTLLASCGQNDFVKLNEKFALWATDDRADMSLCFLDFGKYYIGVAGPCIFAAGVDDEFIILKEHPVLDGKIQEKVTSYYIVPIKEPIESSEEAREALIGPLTLRKFEAEKVKQKVSEKLDFTVSFWDLD
jgi:hypothetical protein